MGEFKTVGLTEEKMKRIISLPYELLARQMSEEIGCEINVTITVEKKSEQNAS